MKFYDILNESGPDITLYRYINFDSLYDILKNNGIIRGVPFNSTINPGKSEIATTRKKYNSYEDLIKGIGSPAVGPIRMEFNHFLFDKVRNLKRTPISELGKGADWTLESYIATSILNIVGGREATKEDKIKIKLIIKFIDNNFKNYNFNSRSGKDVNEKLEFKKIEGFKELVEFIENIHKKNIPGVKLTEEPRSLAWMAKSIAEAYIVSKDSITRREANEERVAFKDTKGNPKPEDLPDFDQLAFGAKDDKSKNPEYFKWRENRVPLESKFVKITILKDYLKFFKSQTNSEAFSNGKEFKELLLKNKDLFVKNEHFNNLLRFLGHKELKLAVNTKLPIKKVGQPVKPLKPNDIDKIDSYTKYIESIRKDVKRR